MPWRRATEPSSSPSLPRWERCSNAIYGAISVTDNLVTGVGTDGFSHAAWARGIWSDGGASQLTVTGNTFNLTRSALNLDGLNNDHTDVSHNTFTNAGTGIAVGFDYVGFDQPGA